MSIQIPELKKQLEGRWKDAVMALCPALSESLSKGKAHQPCPRCGGKDRFNYKDDFLITGAAFCNQCELKCADGIDLIMKWNGWELSKTLWDLDLFLGGSPHVNASRGPGYSLVPIKAMENFINKITPKTDYVKKTWNERSVIELKLEAYLQHRGLSAVIPKTMGFHQNLYHKLKDGSTRKDPALLAKIQNLSGDLVGLQRIYLAENSAGKSEHLPNKMLMKSCDLVGSSFHIGEPEDYLQVAEGIETAMAVHQMTGGQPTWASVTSTLMKSMLVPDWVKRVMIFADYDDAGIEAAEALAGRLEAQGIEATIRLPGALDWLDVFVEHGMKSCTVPSPKPYRVKPAVLEEKPNKTNLSSNFEDREKNDLSLAKNNNSLPEIPEYKYFTAGDFEEAEFPENYLINGILLEGQPCLLGGPKKTLKTNISIDLALSLTSETKFLGNFIVNRKCRVGLMSSESGGATIKETMLRICSEKNIQPKDQDLFFILTVPDLDNEVNIGMLNRLIDKCKLDVLILDPAYLMMPGIGTNAGNLFEVGKRLEVISKIAQEKGITPVICHHTRKNANNPNDPPELEDLSWSGFQEWARQWILLGRRYKYNPENPGEHALWLVSGGSAGHSGQWGVDINEGEKHAHMMRTWKVDILDSENLHNENKAHKNLKRENAQNAKKEADIQESREKILDFLLKTPEGETKSIIRDTIMLSTAKVTAGLQFLVESGDIVRIEVKKEKRKYPGFKISQKSVL